jgi:mono/diheme cytochrome c family protein
VNRLENRLCFWKKTLRRLLWLWISAVGFGLRADDPTGLTETIVAGGATDAVLAENIWLYVPAGQPATPFVPVGAFTAKWEGAVSLDLRAEVSFYAEYTGELRLVVNDSPLIEGAGKGDEAVVSPKAKLTKGANKLLVEYKCPASGDAFVRLYWSSKDMPLNPIPNASLTSKPAPAVSQGTLARLGRDLFFEHRCAKCHTAGSGAAELEMDAPAFAGIGSRRNFDWLARWIENPHALRPTTPMPAIFNGSDAKSKAEAVAAFLSTLKSDAGSKHADPGSDAVTAGKALYDKLHCAACHNQPDSSDVDPKKIGQKQVLAKFAPGALVSFLLKPEEHFAWIRMPNFRLSEDEAGQLAAYLTSASDKATDRPAPGDDAVVARGKDLVLNSGCLSCHKLEIPNAFSTKKLADLAADAWTRGCMADQPVDGSKAPRYEFSDDERKALRAFASTDRTSLARNTAADFLDRQSQHLNCRECHGKFDGFPAFELLGGKLKPDWASKFIAGKEAWKPRPWLESRMPGFAAYAAQLGAGLATAHGLPPGAPTDTAPDPELAKTGQKLVSANGGFACVSCHSVAEFGATQVFEAPGINLAHSFERIQPSYYRRWVRSPISIDPTTKMPVYFDDEGKSPLSDVLGGDGPKTIQSMWEYIRLGDKMPRPE